MFLSVLLKQKTIELLKNNTLKPKYRRTATYFTDYLALKKSTTNLPVSRIDEALLEDFFLFLRKEKKNGHNSSVALMNCLRTILDKPVKDGVIRINPFRSVSLTRKPVIRDYLTMDELRALQNLSGLSEAMERKTIARLAGINKKLFMHLGRHTFATTVTLSQGVSIESVSKMLGHTSLKHTQLYAKIVNNRVKKDMEGIRNSFV